MVLFPDRPHRLVVAVMRDLKPRVDGKLQNRGARFEIHFVAVYRQGGHEGNPDPQK